MSSRQRSVRLALAATATAACQLGLPAGAAAHGLVGRADLPIPSWLFGWAAAIVLAVSFLALSSLWREPRFANVRARTLFRVPVAVDVVCGLIGIAVFAAVVYAGFAGTRDPTRNLAPTIVYVEFWVGFAVASLLLGDVFRAFNPWLAVARAGERVGLWPNPRPYPERLGRWPVVVGIVAFAWLELVYVHKSDPRALATLAVAYALVQLAGMARFGVEPWSRRADAFGVYFNLYARLSALTRREDRRLELRPPLAGAASWPLMPGSVALLCVAIGSTTFDGFSNGPVWASAAPHLESFFGDLGASQTVSVELAATVGLAACIAVISGFYRLGVRGMESVGGGHPGSELAARFVHTLIPIAFAYALAHYFSLLAYQGQALGYLVSDPLGHGANLFGTARATIDYGIVSGAAVWYVQVAALVCGHVSGLVLAHDRALTTYPGVREATRSQYWMLVVMVGFTSLGLWLLSAISTTSGG